MPRLPPGQTLLGHAAAVARRAGGPPLNVLMVAEKPSVAEAIAVALSGGTHSSVRSATPVHTFQSSFLDRPATVHVTAVAGHLFSVDFPAAFNNWNVVDPLTLFECPTERVEQRRGGIANHIKESAKGMDALVLWLDGDREGENIAFQVWKVARSGLKQSRLGAFSVFRSRFSALTAQEIRTAFRTLELPNPNLALAVDVRQEIDLRIGCAFTRFQTKYFQGRYGNLNSATISFGPCQTPTLALCVQRHDEILSFVSEPFWTLVARVDAGRTLIVRGRRFVDDRTKADRCLAALKGVRKAVITSVAPKTKSLPPPAALDTVRMLQLASSLLHLSPQDAMRAAESLYVSGFISYPRTETSRYPASFDLASTLREIAKGEYERTARSILDSARGKVAAPDRGKDKGDHPPITPVRFAAEDELYGSERRVYDLVVRMFLGSLMGPLRYERTTVVVDAGGEELRASGRRLVDRGWAAACHWIWSEGGRNQEHDVEGDEGEVDELDDETEDESALPPDLAAGREYAVESFSLQQGQTKPPGYLTESQLLGAMERRGIGTDASMSTHIANIVDRNYVRVGGNRREVIPTELGIVVIHGYERIDPDLAATTLRSAMESEIGKIADGAVHYTHVLSEQLRLYRDKFLRFVGGIAGMDSLFEVSFSSINDTGKIMGRCGACRRYLKWLPLRPQRLHCATCQRTYDLPQNGAIKLYREQQCPLDGFELVYFSTGSTARSFVLCPKCYNEPPVPGIKAPMPCSQCTIAKCPHSLARTGLFPCPNVIGGTGSRGTSGSSGGVERPCDGTVCLDGTSAPRWKLSCNSSSCNFAAIFSDSVHGVATVASGVPSIEEANAASGVCETCGAVLINIRFGSKAGRADLESICVVCDEEDVEGVLEAKLVRMAMLRSRGRGRGRGRRGRGRGRGGHRRQGSDEGPAFAGAEGRMVRKGDGPSLGAFFGKLDGF
ncbi:putative DNA topoisomerase 3-beta [Hyaloraphidium curvatum]|nr:putative DNA topoisomerase 3-beta [Hyaloraphidium curvatum]